jgi:hypothetical protein
MVFPPDDDTIRFPSGEKETELTSSVYFSKVAASRPVFESQTRTVRRLLTVCPAIHFPSCDTAAYVSFGVNKAVSVPWGCFFEGPDTRTPVSAFQLQTSPPLDAETILLPSGEKATNKAQSLGPPDEGP